MEYIDIDLVNREGNRWHNATSIGRGTLDRAHTLVLAKVNDPVAATGEDGRQSMVWDMKISGFMKLKGWPNRWIEEFEAENAVLTREQWAATISQPGVQSGVGSKLSASVLPIVFNGYVYGLVNDPNDRHYKIMLNLTHICGLGEAKTTEHHTETIVYLGYGLPVMDTIYRVHLAVKPNKIENMLKNALPILEVEEKLRAECNRENASLEFNSGTTQIENFVEDTDCGVNFKALKTRSVMQWIYTGAQFKLFNDYMKKPDKFADKVIATVQHVPAKLNEQVRVAKSFLHELEKRAQAVLTTEQTK